MSADRAKERCVHCLLRSKRKSPATLFTISACVYPTSTGCYLLYKRLRITFLDKMNFMLTCLALPWYCMCKAQLLIRGYFEHHSLYCFQQYILEFGIFKIFDDDTNWSKLLV